MFLHPPSPLAGALLSVKLHPLQRCHFFGWMFSTPGRRELFLDPQEEGGGGGGAGVGGGGGHLALQMTHDFTPLLRRRPHPPTVLILVNTMEEVSRR